MIAGNGDALLSANSTTFTITYYGGEDKTVYDAVKKEGITSWSTESHTSGGFLGIGATVTVELECHGQHAAFEGLSDWDGSAGTFYPLVGYYPTITYYLIRALYSSVKPYVLRSDIFLSNPNYFRSEQSGSSSATFLFWETDSDSASFAAAQLHKYAVPIASVDSFPVSTSLGTIRISFTRADGSQDYRDINVRVQKRWCTAY